MDAEEAKLFQQLLKAKSQYENYTSVTKYTAIIDCIIHVGDLDKITVSRIIKSLEALYGDEVTNQNKQLKSLIYERFHKYQSYKDSTNYTDIQPSKKTKSSEAEKVKKKPTKRKMKQKDVNPEESKRMVGLDRKVYISPELAEIIGKTNPETNELWNRKEITTHIWKYVKANNLQNPKDGRDLLVHNDLKFSRVFPADVESVTAFSMQRYLQRHISYDENNVFEV